MAMVKQPTSPGTRVEVGDAIVAAAKSVKLGAASARFKAFVAAHRTFSSREAAVQRAVERLRAQQQRSGAADATQDFEVEQLAGALAGDGYARSNPFKVMGFPAASKIQGLPQAEEAKVVIQLAAAVKRRKDASAPTLAAAARADKAARAVQAAHKPLKGLEKAKKAAIAARDAVEQPWERRFASLKLAAKLVAAEGDSSVLQDLFTPPSSAAPRQKAAKAKKAKKAAAKKKAPPADATDPDLG